MLIKKLYAMPNATSNLIEMPDGKLYIAHGVGRHLTENDLKPIVSPLSKEDYLRTSHALEYDSDHLRRMMFNLLGLTTVPIVEYRKRAGLTQQALADKSGVNIRQIQKVEGGEAEAGNLTARNLIAIADALGVEPQSLI